MMISSLLSYYKGNQLIESSSSSSPGRKSSRNTHPSISFDKTRTLYAGHGNNGTISYEDSEEDLAHLGLSWNSIAETNGQLASENFGNILSKIREKSEFSQYRVKLASALLTWRTTAAENEFDEVIIQYSSSILDIISSILHRPDDGISPKTGYAFGTQMPALYLTQLLQGYYEDHPETIDENLIQSILWLFGALFNRPVTLVDASDVLYDGSSSPVSAGSIRTEVIRLLFKCFPHLGAKTKYSRVDDPVRILFHFLDPSLPISIPQSLRDEAVAVLCDIGVSNPRLFYPLAADLVYFVKLGYSELAFIIRSNIDMFSNKLDVVEYYLDYLLSFLGFNEMSSSIVEIAEINVESLVTFVPALVREIGSTVMKSLLMNVLLMIGLYYPKSFSNIINTVVDSCDTHANLLIPLFKLLAVVSTAGSTEAIESTNIIINFAKTYSQELSPQQKSALIGALDIAKIKIPASDIFHVETFAILEEFSKYNKKAYKRLMQRNSGVEPESLFDIGDYLITAGDVDTKDEHGFLHNLSTGNVIKEIKELLPASLERSSNPESGQPFKLMFMTNNNPLENLSSVEDQTAPNIQTHSLNKDLPRMESPETAWVPSTTPSSGGMEFSMDKLNSDVKAINLFGTTLNPKPIDNPIATASNNQAEIPSDVSDATNLNPTASPKGTDIFAPIEFNRPKQQTWDRVYTKEEEDFFESLKNFKPSNAGSSGVGSSINSGTVKKADLPVTSDQHQSIDLTNIQHDEMRHHSSKKSSQSILSAAYESISAPTSPRLPKSEKNSTYVEASEKPRQRQYYEDDSDMHKHSYGKYSERESSERSFRTVRFDESTSHNSNSTRQQYPIRYGDDVVRSWSGKKSSSSSRKVIPYSGF